jgi:prepilin peptidase CpaA
VQTAVLIIGIAILTIIAHGDVRKRRIPNALSLAVAALGLTRILLVDDPVAAGYTLMAGAAILVVAFLLFWRDVIGGGDAKLLPAMALFIGYRNLLDFLFLMSLCGGVLALAIMARDNFGPRRLRPPASGPGGEITASIAAPTRSTVPYGVAIAVAGVITLILDGSFTR